MNDMPFSNYPLNLTIWYQQYNQVRLSDLTSSVLTLALVLYSVLKSNPAYLFSHIGAK